MFHTCHFIQIGMTVRVVRKTCGCLPPAMAEGFLCGGFASHWEHLEGRSCSEESTGSVGGESSIIFHYNVKKCFLLCWIISGIYTETSNRPGDSASLQPRFGALWLLAFPKTKITFEREEISDRRWDSGKYDRAADSNWEKWGPKVLTRYNVSCTLYLLQ